MPGKGKIVVNTEKHSTPSAPYFLIKDRFAVTLATAEQWNTAALGYLADINQNLSKLDMPSDWRSILKGVQIPKPTVPVMQPPTDVGNLTLPNNWPDEFPVISELANTPEVNITSKIPIAPDEVNPSIRFSLTAYNATLALKIFTTIHDDLDKGGTGLSKEVEDAILLRDSIRNSKINADKFDSDVRTAGSLGYRFGSGVVASLLLESSEQILRQDRESSSNLLYENYKLAIQSKQFAITSGLNYEKVQQDFLINRDKLTLSAEVAAEQLILNIYNSKLEAFKTKYIGLQTEADVAIARVEVIIKKNENLIKNDEARLSLLALKTDVIKAQVDGKVAGYNGKVAGYVAKNRAFESYYKSLSVAEQMKLAAADLELKKATEEVKALVQEKLGKDALTTDIAKVISQLAQEASSAAWNAVNASATMGYTGSESVNETWSHADTLSEVHQAEHDTNKLF